MGTVKGSKGFSNQLNYDMYNEHTNYHLRQVSTEPTDEVTEFLSELETTGEEITQYIRQGFTTKGTTGMSEMTSSPTEMIVETADFTSESTFIQDAITSEYETDASSESSQTILIVLGVLLAILLIVCCVLACIFARMRRKGFCTVEGKNQATCDDDCVENGMSSQQSPKESMSSGKSENSRSSDKLLTK